MCDGRAKLIVRRYRHHDRWKHVFDSKIPIKIWAIVETILMIKGKPVCKKNLWQTELSSLWWLDLGHLILALSAVMLSVGNSFLEIGMPVVFYFIVCSSRQMVCYLRPPNTKTKEFDVHYRRITNISHNICIRLFWKCEGAKLASFMLYYLLPSILWSLRIVSSSTMQKAPRFSPGLK